MSNDITDEELDKIARAWEGGEHDRREDHDFAIWAFKEGYRAALKRAAEDGVTP